MIFCDETDGACKSLEETFEEFRLLAIPKKSVRIIVNRELNGSNIKAELMKSPDSGC